MKRFLIRLDDACPTMNRDTWEYIANFLLKRNIYPLVGIIPNCKDAKMNYMEPEPVKKFWERMRDWQTKGCTMALHGYDHCYISESGGINPVNKRSEFAGILYDIQAEKLRKGYQILKEEGIHAEWFFAPSHTYDNNTLKALELETPIRKISDTIAFRPYIDEAFLFCPVQSGHFFTPPVSGVWTFCFHPSTMETKEIDAFEQFIKKNHNKFIGFDDLQIDRKKDILDKTLSLSYFTYRKLREKIRRR